MSSPPCEELTPGIAFRGTRRFKRFIFPYLRNQLAEFYFHCSTWRSSADVFFAKYTSCASWSRSSFFFALLIGLFLISSCSRILCDKWVVWWDRNTPDRGCRQWKALSRIDRSHLVFVCTGPLVIKTRKEKKRQRLICRSPECKLVFGKKIWNNAAIVCLGLNLPPWSCWLVWSDQNTCPHIWSVFQ